MRIPIQNTAYRLRVMHKKKGKSHDWARIFKSLRGLGTEEE